MPGSKIVMYARERYCADVARSRDRLNELGLSWIEHDIEADSNASESLQQHSGRRNVPTLIIGDAVLVEPSNDELDNALRKAGFNIK